MFRKLPAFWMPHWWRASISSFDVVRIVLGAVLLWAAAAKAHQIATDPPVVQGILGSAALAMGIATAELALAVRLFSGVAQHAARAVSIAWFVAAFGAALAKQLSHAPSCGCFGIVAITPIWAIACDVAVLLWLGRCAPSAPVSYGQIPARWRALIAAVAWTAITGTFLGVFGRMDPVVLLATSATLQPESRPVVLEPNRWLGQGCPLLAFTDIGNALAVGRWEVLLVRPDCAKCREAIEHVSRIAAFERRYRGVGIALIDVTATSPPSSRNRTDAAGRRDLEVGYLRPEHRWVVQTPVSFWLEDGIVVLAEPSDNKTTWALETRR